MGYDRAAPRRKVELESYDDPLWRAKALSPDLAAVVERLLAGHLKLDPMPNQSVPANAHGLANLETEGDRLIRAPTR